jgi:tripartite-type tricarboxylate transporter receptor subunit TctC
MKVVERPLESGMGKTSVLTALLASIAITAGAQTFPVKPIRIVTTEAGSGTDFGARMVAQCISGPLGQQVVVENRGGVMPNEVVAKAQPDGYTLVHNGSALWLLPFVQDNLGWQPLKDFIAVSMTDTSPNVLLVQPSFAAKSVRELIAMAKAKPGELNYARAAPAGPTHLSAELFNTLAGLRIVPIPYKGGGPAVIGLLSAQAHMMFAPAAVAMPHVNSGKLRGLAVTTAQPSALFPQLPTMASAGVPGYESIAMFGEFVPAGTPMSIVNRLSQEIARCMQRPDVKEKFLNAGVESVGTSPENFASIVKSEMTKWGRLIKDAGIRVE